MAIPAVPVIGDLPPAPTRSDGPADFTPKADTMIGALQPMVVQFNIALQWMNGRLTDTQAAQAAAAASAEASAQSAAAANASKNDAAAQVGLAADQVELAAGQVVLANAAKADAQAAAVASGAAAGLPLERVPFSVLQINAAGAVSWGYGLPDRAAAKVGQSLILGPNKVPTYGWAGDQVGDLRSMARVPGADYLPAAGGIYLKASYPLLAAAIGSIGTTPGLAWSYTALAAGATSPGVGTDGKGVWLKGNKRSNDNGITFPTTVTGITDSYQAILSDGNVTWLAATESAVQRSTDNGLTFTNVIASGGGTSSAQLATDKQGTWIWLGYSTLFKISKDNGSTWSDVNALKGAQGVCYIGANTWISSSGYRSTDGGLTWALYGTAMGSSTVFGCMAYLGNNVVIGLNVSTVRRSADGGYSWSNTLGPGLGSSGCSISHNGGGVVVVSSGNSQHAVSFDYGLTWQTIPAPSGSGNMYFGAYGMGKFLTAGSTGYCSSAQTFDYDTTTQFKLPSPTPIQGVKHYIKALEAA